MEKSVINLTHDWILSGEELGAVKVINQEEMTGNACEVRARDYAYEIATDEQAEKFCFDAQDQVYNAPAQKKLFKMRVQQINVIEIEVEDLNANEAHDKALKIIKNAPEMGEVIRTDLGNSTIEEV